MTVSPKTTIINTQVTIIGTIEERLVLGKQEWLTIRLENNQLITIRKTFCTEVIKNNDE
jgi:hypothetical protein